ncbi:PEP-CTERM sorting domain-containing protein [Methyloversatilis discipulorum]|uniref:PEP-CTERM sorting domain-containing protein n=1 Tax=Methyloversatilis discipulorum TaxID=1119528 RepID=UPI003AF4C544
MKNTLLALGAAIGALCTTLPAHAVTLESATLNGNLVDSSFSTPSLIALDLSLLNHAPLRFSFVIDADDVSRGSADFNAIVRDVGGLGIGSLTLTGVRFEVLSDPLAATLGGSLLPAAVFVSAPTTLSVGTLTLAGDPVSELYLGNPFFEAERLDWRIGFAGLNAGDRLTLDLSTTPAVPEPDDWAMMLAGLGMIVLSAARRIGR